jgi:phosphatidylglycerophosphatase C
VTEPTPRRVAAWDFDETITERDTLVPFLTYIGGRRRLAAALARHAPLGAQGLRSTAQRDAFKERVLGTVLGGREQAEVEAAGLAYAKTLPKGFKRASLERIGHHRSNDHELVIVSASLVYYLRPIASDLGFHHVIAVDMEVGADGRLTGALVGPNVRKAEKAVRLTAWLGDGDYELWAYGDSSGDEELLAMAHHPTWVGKRATRNP